MKQGNPPNLNYAWSGQIIRELVLLGCDSFYIAPGSRSSPLALSAAECGRNVVVHFDERGVGFAALGHARATGLPAVVITTSGSAVANLWPAVCEANNDHVPMIMITADRPPELRDTGANQTMDQVKFFGSYVRWQLDLPCPDEHVNADFLLRTVDYAVYRAMHQNPGPVHINQMFREPLAPLATPDASQAWLAALGRQLNRKTPLTTYSIPEGSLSAASSVELNNIIARTRRGVIIAGAARNAAETLAMNKCADKLGWPLLPDIRSGLRLGEQPSQVIQMADQLLLSEKARKALTPDTILHLGGSITSKRIQQFMAARSAKIILVNEWDTRLDADSRVDLRLTCSLQDAVRRMKAGIGKTSNWTKKWRTLDDLLIRAWRKEAAGGNRLSEPLVAHIVSTELPSKQALVLASSMPIRDMDMFGAGNNKDYVVASNRGVSGIDGNLASAIGFSNGRRQPVTLVVGDLALLHDLNSLAMLKSANYPVTIVVINNDGGGIFSFLPVAASPRNFEVCFGVPHGNAFAAAATMFGLDYVNPSTPAEFTTAYSAAVRINRSTIIEVQTDRTEHVREHRRIQARLKKLIDHAI